jgi:formylmethanofuran dehydrogenase subunit C
VKVLRPRCALDCPVEAEGLVPERLAEMTTEALLRLPLAYGRFSVPLGELFDVEADGAADAAVVLEGDFSRVKRIGENMAGGSLEIRGNAGMHLGAGMSGGTIRVLGNVDAWAGAMMSGGRIEITGSAGPSLAGAYPGETRGMRGGMVLVRGDTGLRAGERLRRGLIVVGGCTGDFPGLGMLAGTLVAFGTLGIRAGAGSKRGTLVALGGARGEMLPTYREACAYRPVFLDRLLRFLEREGFPVTAEHRSGRFRRWVGDANELGKGEILVHEKDLQ